MISGIRKPIAMLLSAVLGAAFLPMIPQEKAEAVSDGVSNIVARADFLYNMVWTARQDLKGWRNQYVYHEGTTHHIPYAQPDHKGAFLYFDTTFETFLEAAEDTESLFYTQQSYNNDNAGSYSTYYGLDCSSMVSYCWELPERTMTGQWPQLDVTSYGKCTSANVGKIEIGDAINKTYSHVVLVTDIFYNNDGTVNSYEITEQTTPEMKRTIFTPEELAAKYSTFTIYRYNQRDAVTPPPDMPCSTVLTVTEGSAETETLFAWDTIIEDAAYYDVKIWNAACSDVEPYYTESGLTNAFCSIQLPAGEYEARVDVTTSGKLPFESNTVLFTVTDAAVPETTEPTAVSMTLLRLPDQLEYHMGESVDTAGCIVEISETDASGTEQSRQITLPDDSILVDVSEFDSARAGTYTIYLKYMQDGASGQTAFTVTVKGLGEDVTGLLGDVNQDGTVDSADAALVLIESAYRGTGDSVFSEIQTQAGDVNGDGETNAADASVILAYAAEKGAGNADVTIEDLV